MSDGLTYHVLDVFTVRALAGNPLAVVMDADGLDGDRMQAIAREFNLSETVFVLRPRLADAQARIRIFTPGRELPFAGHPTVGTACLLADLGSAPDPGASILLEEEVGPVPVRVSRGALGIWYAQLTTAVLPSFDPVELPVTPLAAALGLSPKDIVTGSDAPRSASCGVPYNLVPLHSRGALARAALQTAEQAKLGGSNAFYLYYQESPSQLHARMFAPELGVVEDPATGSAAAALCGHLADRSPMADGSQSWTIVQGVEMQRPSRIDIEADKRGGGVIAVRVGGHSVRIASGTLNL